MTEKWTRDAAVVYRHEPGHQTRRCLLHEETYGDSPPGGLDIDELIAEANLWLANEAEFARQAEVIAAFAKAVKAHRDNFMSIASFLEAEGGHHALLDALALAEPEPEPEPEPSVVAAYKLLVEALGILIPKGGE